MISNVQCSSNFGNGRVGDGYASYQINSNVRYTHLRYGSCYSDGNSRGVTEYAFPSIRMIEGVN